MINSTLLHGKVNNAMNKSRRRGVKLFTLVMFLLSLTLGAKANPVDMRRACEVGAKFINANTAMRVSPISGLQLVTTYRTSNNDAAFHVFNTPKGFVIVSANDCATPILGYSEEGHFDVFNIPVQMQEYLQGFVAQIQYGIDNHLVADETIARQWELVETTGRITEQRNTTAVAPLLTDSWGQGCYYNDLCPEDPDGACGHVVTGCVATSFAQIMHYWSYPVVGTGSHTYTPSGYPTQTANFGATTYQWANMPNSLSSSSSSTQINAVATLMWHCGVAVNMMYGAGGSGAYSEDVATALVNYFGYSNELTGVYKSDYSNAEWLSMIKNSLDLGRPVHYSGNDGSGQSGHAFVCDGYDSNDYLHFNWGWYGSYNNYFALDALTPGGYNFSSGNYAILNIHPSCASGTTYQVTATASPSYGGTVYGSGSYDCGGGCTLTAVPADGYMFCSWTEGGATVSNEPTYSFTVMGSRNLMANFVEASSGSCVLEFTFNDSYGDGWNGNALSVSYSEGCTNYEELTLDNGSSGTMTRNVVDGSHIVLGWVTGGWPEECSFTVSYEGGNVICSGSNLSSSFAYEFDVNCDGTVPTYYDITATANPTQGGSVSGAGSFTYGEVCTLTATANSGYSFTEWTKNGVSVSTNATYSFTVTENADYIANFNYNGGGNIIEIGVGGTATNSYLPNYEFYNYSLTQQIYTADEIGTAGTINSIAFYYTGTATRTLDIYMVHTAMSSFSGNNDWITVTAADKVYSGSLTYTANAWNTLVLDTPFAYDGTSNLAVIVDDNTGSYVSSIGSYVFDASGMAIRIYSDGTNYDPMAPPMGSGAVLDVKNQIQLGISTNDGGELTVYDGAATNGYVPVYGFYADAYLKAEMVYPSSELAAMTNSNINSIKFYASTPATDVWTSTFQVFIKEVDEATIDEFSGTDGATVVYEGLLNGTDSEMIINFSTPYHYNGGNLLVGVYNITTGNYKSITWAGETVDGASVQGYSYNGLDAISPTQRNFLPKTTFYYNGGSYSAILVSSPDPIDLGYRPNGAWMRPLEVNIFNEGAVTTINNVSVTNDYFQMSLGNTVIPFVLYHDNGFDLTIGTVGTASGVVNANLVVNHGNDEETQFDVIATAYTPVCPDVWELAQTVNSFPYTATLNSANHPLYNNYRLPPAGIVDGADAVYKLVFTEDTYLNASVTSGEDGKVALYKEGFNGVGGPDLYNNYTGPEIVAEDWLYYDNGEWFTSWYLNGGDTYWGIKIPAEQLITYNNYHLTKVAMYDTEYNTSTVTVNIYKGGDTPADGTLVLTQDFEPYSDYTFHEVILDEAIDIDPTQDLWITMHAQANGGYPAASCHNVEDPNGRWYFDGSNWVEFTDYNDGEAWMLRGFVTNASGRTIALDNRDDAFDVTIGEGTNTTGYHPFYTLYNYSISEQIFLASELAEAGANTSYINMLSWYATNAPGYEQQGISIWMANVDYSEISATSVLTNDMTLVYTGTMTPEVGWNEFVFNEGSFAWDGESNVLVCVQRNNGSWNSTVYWQSHEAGFNASGRLYTDNAPYDMTNEYYNLSLQTFRANTRFTFSNDFEGEINDLTVTPGTYYLVASSTSNEWTIEINADEVPCPNPAYNPSPANYAEVNPDRTIELSWKFGPRTTEYKLMFGTTEDCEQTLVDWTRELSRHFTLPALLDETTYYWKIVERNDGCDEGVESPLWSFTTHLNSPRNLYAEENFIMEGSSAVLYWSAPNRTLHYYNVYQDGELIGSTTDTYYVVDGLSYNMNGYGFYVTGVFDAGESDPSNYAWVYVSGLGTVDGHVYEQDGTTGIANVTVSFTGYDEYGYYNSYNFTTDANGYYEGSLRAGSYIARASCGGYQDKQYPGSVSIVFNEFTSGINFNLDELYKPVTEVVAEYYPDAENPNSPYVKIHWGNNTSDWLYYDDGIYVTSVGAGGVIYWATMFPAATISSYIGTSLTKVALYENDYNTNEVTVLIYLGGDNAPGTLVSTMNYNPVGGDAFHEVALTTPVVIDGTQNLWIVFSESGSYPANACVDTGEANNRWVSLDGADWMDLASAGVPGYGWMIRGFVSSGRGEMMIANNLVNSNQQHANMPFALRKGSNNGILSMASNITQHNVGTPSAIDLEEFNRSFQYYRVYRTNAYNNGPYTTDNTVLLADNVTDTLLIDVSWQDAEAGVYKWGVSCVYEGNRESEISWGELRRSLSIPRRNPLGRVLNNTQEPNAGQAPAFDVSEHPDLPIFRASNSEAVVVRNSSYGYDFCHFILNAPTNLNSYGYSNNAFTRGACFMNGTIYFADNEYKFGKLDPETGVTIIATNTPFDMVEYNPVNGKMYGTNTWDGELYEVNPENGSYLYIATIPSSFLMTFTITNDGRFILCDANEDCIKEYNLETGELIPLIYVDWDIYYGQDFAIDRETNEIYWAALNNSENSYPLIKIDLANYSLITLGYFESQVSGFAIFTEANFIQGERESAITWSNFLDKDMFLNNGDVNLTVTLNSGDSPAGTMVSFTNLNSAEQQLYPVADILLDGSGYYAWDSFRKGDYQVTITKEGYAILTDNVSIWDATALSYVLEETTQTPTNLYVSSTGWAQWNGPGNNLGQITSTNSFSIDFENGIPEDWTTIDANGDGYTWTSISHISDWTNYYDNMTLDWAHNGIDAAISGSWISSIGILYPDDYLISPLMNISYGSHFSFWAVATDPNYAADHFGVFVSETSNTDPSSFELVQEWTLSAKDGGRVVSSGTTREGKGLRVGTWNQFDVDLSAYAGRQVYIAFRHFNCSDQYIISIDDVELIAGRDGGRHYEYNQVVLTDLQGNVLYTENTPNKYCQLPVDNLVEGETYHCKVASVYSSGLTEWAETDWVYQACDNYEGANDLFAITTEDGNLVSWTYPVIERDGKTTRGNVAYACNNNSGSWVSYDIDNPLNATTLNNFSLYGGDYCGLDGYVYSTYNGNSYKIEPQTGIVVETIPIGLSYGFYDCAWDYTTNTMYGNDNQSLYIWNLEDNTLQYVGDMGVSIEVLACDLNGDLFGIAVGSPANLYKINKTDASIELVGSTGQTCDYYWQSGAIDYYTGKFYWTNYLGDGGSLVEVNLQTGEGVVLYTGIGDQTSFSVPFDGGLSVLGALVYRDNELVGFTRDNSYLDEGDLNSHQYTIRVVYGGPGICPDNNIYYSMSCPQTAFMGETFQITATASPSAGGSITGAGIYGEGQTCTLTATANEGYAFINWTKDGVEVSTNATYSFTVTEDAAYVAHFSSDGNHWNVDVYQYPYNMSVTGIIQINGIEQQTSALEIGAFCGDVCRGTQRLTYFPQVNRYLVFFTLYGDAGDVMSFRLYDHALGEELDLVCSSTITFVPDGFLGTPFDPYVFDFGNMTVDQVSNFSQGYNWWSTYIEQNGIDGLGMLQDGLGDNGITIRSQASGYNDYYAGYGWFGSLTSINNESSYRVITNAACSVTMTGTLAVPSEHPITLSQGWTWIGYVPSTSLDINIAMAGMEASAGDILKSQHGYADYYPGYGWFGSLNTIEPGMGLMYYSNNSQPISFIYPDSGRALKANMTAENNHWVPNTYAYPDNMTVMAVVDVNGMELNSDNYELAAFVNGECRGSVKLVYTEPLSRHMAFLTVSGKDVAELSFRLYDTETGTEYYDAEEHISFSANAMVGEADTPFVVHFRGMTGMDEFGSSVQVYPNPVAPGERFSIVMNTESKAPVRLEIVNALGVVVSVETSTQIPTSIVAPITAGVYTVRIITEDKGTAVRKLIVK